MWKWMSFFRLVLTAVMVLASSAAGATTTQPAASQPCSDLDRFFVPPAEFAGQLGQYPSVMKFDDGRAVRSPADWQQRRLEIRNYWLTVIGTWPDLIEHPTVQYLSKEHVETFTRCQIRIAVAADNVQTCYLLIPDGPGPFPAVLVVWYNAGDSAGLGRTDEFAYGYDLARRGFVTLCLGDTGKFTNRKQEYVGKIQPISYMAYTAANAANLLADLPQVDSQRIGVMGHSFGGKWAMFASCLYDKFAAAVWCDPGIVWNEEDSNANWWDAWYLGYEQGKKRPQGRLSPENPRTGAYKQLIEQGHNLHELHALMAPRPFLVSGGGQDQPPHWVALNHTVAVNDFLGFKDRVAMTNRQVHNPTPEAREQIYLFLERFLMPGAVGQASQPALHSCP